MCDKNENATVVANNNGKCHEDEREFVDTPNELFKKMVINDAKQNKRLSGKFSSPSQDSQIMSQKKPPHPQKEGGITWVRFVICTLGLTSLAISQMSRMVLNLSVTEMIDPSMLATKGDAISSSDGSCPWPEDEVGPVVAVVVDDDDELGTCASITTMTAPTTTTAQTTTPSSFSYLTTSEEPSTSSISSEAATQTEITSEQTTTVSQSPVGFSIDAEDNMEALPDFEDTDLNDGAISTMIPAPTPTTEQVVTGGFQFRESDPNTMKPLLYVTTIANETTKVVVAVAPRFKWTMKQQSVLLGGFYYSYFVFMVLGGRMAEMYGAKYVLLLSVAGSGLINLATPWMASTSLPLLVGSRVLMGAMQAGVFPGMYALFAKWLTMTEASIYAPLIKMNLRLGMTLGTMVPGLVSSWPQVFYLTGFLSLAWSLMWLFVATSGPADNKWVTREEYRHIMRKKTGQQGARQQGETGKKSDLSSTDANVVAPTSGSMTDTKGTKKTPWIKIITSRSVIGLIIVKLTFNYAFDFLAILLPTHLKNVHHLSKQKISAVTTGVFSIQVFLVVFVGWLAKVVIQRKPFGVTRTIARKLFQGVASFGMVLTFTLLSFNGCNMTFVVCLLMLTSFLSMFTAGGETMLPYDLSEEYPATIMAVANSIANLSAVTTTTLAGFILGNQASSYDRWNILMYLIAGANLIGGLAFTFLVRAKPIDFSSSSSKEDVELAPISYVKKSDSDFNETERRVAAAETVK